MLFRSVVFAKNPVHNAMGLVMTLVSIAIIYITLNATFVAMVQMLVYAGAVMTFISICNHDDRS